MGGRKAWIGWWMMLVASVGGCAHGLSTPAVAPEGWAPTLLVVSDAVDHVAVRVNGLRIGTVTRGRNCLRVPAISGSLHVDFVALSGRASAPEPLLLTPGAHWRLELGPDGRLARDVLSLGPVEQGCAPAS